MKTHQTNSMFFTITFMLLGVAYMNSSCGISPTAEIAAYGDSVTWGYGGLPGGWVHLLANRTGHQISNLAIPGEKTEGGAERIDQALASVPGAKVFIIMHGGNDWVGAFREPRCDRDCEPEVKEANYIRLGNNLRTMRKHAVKAGKRVVFATYWPSSPVACNQYTASQFIKYQNHMMRLNTELAKVGEEFGDHVVRLDELKEMADEADNFFDCLHPSVKGYEKITERWAANEHKWAP